MQLSGIQLVAFCFLPLLTFATTLATKLNLYPVDSHQNIRPFKLAKLDDAKGDLSKRWFVYFYVWDEQKNKLIRKREYISTKYKTALERRAAAKMLIKEINELLQDGHIIRNAPEERIQKKKEEPKVFSITEAFTKILAVKEKTLRPKTLQKLRTISNTFVKFIRPKLYLHQLSKTDIIRYSDFLMSERDYAAVTRNDHIEKLRSFFREMIEREWMEENPAVSIKKIKETQSTKNKAYNPTQQQQIIKLVDPQLALSIKFMYYCFMRPNEIRLLKIKDINLESKKIFIQPDVAKNKKAEYVSIPNPFLKVLEELDLSSYDDELYLIGKTAFKDTSIIPNKTPFSYNMMSNRHRKILKQINLFNKDYTFYSWKHSGVVAAFKAKIDIKSIQFQCRHSSIEITDTYLKSLGLNRDNDVYDGMPEL